MLAQILGSLTLVFGVMMVFLGLTAQIKKNQLEKKCGQPLILALLALAVYFCRAGYAVAIDSYYILIPDAVGVILSVIIIRQYFKYRH